MSGQIHRERAERPRSRIAAQRFGSGPFTSLWLLVFLACASAAEWTVGVYMCADNSLSEQSYVDIAEMAETGSSPQVNVVVQVDRPASDSLPGCRRYRVDRGHLELLEELGDIDMADAQTLAGFAAFIRARFDARNYLLVLWDHGNGWYEGYGPNRAMFIDGSHGHQMGVAGGELAQALAGVRGALGGPVRALAFDACFMGMVEVAYEVSGSCDFFLASEGLVPAGGLPYQQLIAAVAARPFGPVPEMLRQVCTDYVACYPGEDVCLSAIDMHRLRAALPVMAASIRDSLALPDPRYAAARAAVQTFPAGTRPPCSADHHVDFLHYWQLAPGPDSLKRALSRLVVANSATGHLVNAEGLACWFPDRYLGLKSLAGSYAKLAFADTVPWLGFMNCYFGSDDVKPSPPELSQPVPGHHGDGRLTWSRAFDLAPVTYQLFEAAGVEERLRDDCQDFGNWSTASWATSERYAHSGQSSFFSGTGANLDNRLELTQGLHCSGGALLSCYVLYSTEESQDSSGEFSRDICYVEWSDGGSEWQVLDSLYGAAQSWRELRHVLPAATDLRLRFRYDSNAGTNGLGVFLDDIVVYAFESMRVAARGLADTTCHVFNLPRNPEGYSYFVTASDTFGNVSSASQFRSLAVETWAEPYTRPAPFNGPCQLVLDFPQGETPDVSVYTLSGALVRRFEGVASPVIDWDGRNQAGRELADGLYLVSVKGEGFHRLGRIAKVKR